MTKTDLSLAVTLDRECYPENPLTSDQWRKVVRGVGGLDCWLFPGHPSYCVLHHSVEGGYPVVRLLRLGVGSGVRRRGIGSELLNHLRAVNVECVLKETNLAGLKLLCKNGFEVMGLVGADKDKVVLYRRGKES